MTSFVRQALRLFVTLCLLNCALSQEGWGKAQTSGWSGGSQQASVGTAGQAGWGATAQAGTNGGWMQGGIGSWRGNSGGHGAGRSWGGRTQNQNWGGSYGRGWGGGQRTWNQGHQSNNKDVKNHLITCTQLVVPADPTMSFSMAVSFSKNNINNNYGWGHGWGHQMSQLSAEIQISTGANFPATPQLNVVITELSQFADPAACTTNELGNIIPIRQKTSKKWGWGNQNPTFSLDQVTLTAGATRTFTINNLPFKKLQDLAGHSLALCETVNTVNTNWGSMATCSGAIPLCCRLGYSSTSATLPIVP